MQLTNGSFTLETVFVGEYHMGVNRISMVARILEFNMAPVLPFQGPLQLVQSSVLDLANSLT